MQRSPGGSGAAVIGPINLSLASRLGLLDVTALLLGKGADVNASQGGYYGNALVAASFCGHREVVQQLPDKGADLNAQGGTFGKPLQGAGKIKFQAKSYLLQSSLVETSV